MSLLIKALDKAQAEKAQAKGGAAVKSKVEKPTTKTKGGKATEALSLEAIENNTPSKPKSSKVEADKATTARKKQLDDVPEALKGTAAETSQKPTTTKIPEVATASREAADQSPRVPAQAQAANVFTAKQVKHTSLAAKLALVIGFIALGIMGALAYWYQTVMNAPDVVIPPRPTVSQEVPEPLPEPVAADALITPDTPEIVEVEVVENEVFENDKVALDVMANPTELVEAPKALKQPSESSLVQKVEQVSLEKVTPAVEETLTVNETVVGSNEQVADSSMVIADLGMASESASIKMTRQQTTSGVNPVLMRAYEAYKAGNDNQAQQDYMQVLKRYGPNVDAMLGLGAIATRQGRQADANSWYRKVLEVEPRNELAKSGLINVQQGQFSQPQANESNIKSMIANAPNDANLHAALGDLYAQQQQWPDAQQAYFDAYRFNPSAENAFNLGVSLDQLGKPALALPYYREALQKSAQSNAIDAEALKARIASIE